MKPLRLQIVVQPRVLPSPSNLAPSEPVIKWLEVCTGDPTIQELSETLEKRFLQRNHRPLNIKILKFLDDIELFPDNKVRDIFEDVKDAKHGDNDLSIVKVYRNPPTTVELADPRRFESLPPDSLARPIKRPPSPHLRRPPPPLFADAVRNEIHDPFNRRDPQLGQFEDELQAPNKRRKIQSFRTTAYTNDPDQAIDSREIVDDSHVFSQAARQHPSQAAQVEDSQTSPPEKRSDPYGTPISSQISQQEGGRSREVGMVSVPDSPPDRALTRSRESLRLSTAFRDSRSCSPELPSSLGRLSQLQEAPTRAQYSKLMPQTRQPPKRPIEPQVQPPALLAVDTRAVSPMKEPDFLLQREETQYETDTPVLPVEQTGRSELPEATLKASRMPPREVSSEVHMLEPNSSKQGAPIVVIPKPLPSKSSGGKGADGRLKRPTLLKSARAPQRTSRLINGIRQKAPSIPDVFDPIETSEGSSYERDLVRTTKRMKSTAPNQNAKETALQQAAIDNSLIVRLPIPKSIQPRSSSVSLPGVSRDRTTVDTQQHLKAASAHESGHPPVDGKVRNSSIETPIMAPTNVSIRQSLDPSNAVAVGDAQDHSFAEPVNFDPRSASPDRYRQRSNTVTPEQRIRVPADNNAVETVGRYTHTSGDEMSDGLMERQLREKREVKEKAQADFDRITALQRKRQGLQGSKASHLAAEPPDISSVIKEPASSAVLLSEEAKRVYSSDDLEAKRNYGLEQLASTRKQYFKDTEAVDTPQTKDDQKPPASAESKLKKVQAEARKEARRAKEQKDKEKRMAIAKGMDEQKRREVEEKNQRQVEAGIVQERMEANQQAVTAMVSKQKGIKKNQAAQTTDASEKQSSQEIKGRGPDSQRTEDSTRAKNHVETTDADRNKAKVMTPIDQASSSPSKLPERSPKARLNAQRQLQIANQVMKYPKNDLEIVKTPPTVIASNVAKPRARAPKSQKKTGMKQATNKSRETQALNDQRETDTANHVDHAALQAARAGLSVMTRPTATASKRSGTATAGSDIPKVTALSLSAKGTSEVPKDLSIRSSSSSLTRSDPDRARTMTPAFPSSSMQRNPESAEARARRTASVGTKTPNTPSRSALHTTPSASRRSVSFVGGSIISQLHEGKTVDQDSTPTSSGQHFLLNGVGKTPTRTKQTKMSQHIDRKLKGKAIDPSSPVRAVAEKEEIIISSASEASTFYSDESEGERNARAGPSSRKKAKPQNSSLKSASGAPLNNSSSSHATLNGTASRPITGSQVVQNGPQAAETSNARVVQISGARSSQSKAQSDSESGSESASVASTDDVSNLPQITNTRSNGNHEPRTPSNRDGDVAVNAARVRNEERLQLEANQQLQREYSEAMQPKTTINTQPSKLENSKKMNRGSEQMARPAVRAEHEKYGSRVRINPNFDTSGLSQLRKVQAATQMSVDRNAKSATSHKPHVQSFMDSSSASDSGESTSSGSVEDLDPVKEAPGTTLNSAPQKEHLPRVWKDLFGREGGKKT